jgi:hypothetical protein
MKKGIVIAVLAVFSMFAVGVAYANHHMTPDGKLTVDKPAAKFPAKKGPVTFQHKVHGEKLGCVKCHHSDKDLKAGGTPAKLCFDCHGPEAKDKQLDAYEMIHAKGASCIDCHKTDAAAQAAKAPTACKGCHGGAE